jgi:hypothetical protein
MAELDNAELAAAAITAENLELMYEAKETAAVGAGIGGGFTNSSELKVMNYREAMKSADAEEWKDEVRNEKERFDKFKALTPVLRSEVPAGAKIMTTTWAMKKKTNGKLRGRLNARGYEQVDGVHFHADSVAAPVTNAMSVRMMLILMCMNPNWVAEVVDVEGAFLQGKFTDGEELYIEVPDGFEEWYPGDVVLRLNVPIYGTKQAAACFYKRLVEKVKGRKYKRSKADPCLYFVWKNGRLSCMLSWVDDLLVLGWPEDVAAIRRDLESVLTCKSEGKLVEYVGNKIDVVRHDNGLATAKFTQPVLIQKIEDGFDLGDGQAPKTPAVAGQELVQGDGSGKVEGLEATRYRSGTALCMFMMQWSRPEIYNAARGLARQMASPRLAHVQALRHLMRYMVATRRRGLVLSPTRVWDGSKKFKFRLRGRADSNYAANIDDRRSISGGRVFLEEAPACFRSATQKFVTLSVTEAEGAAGVMVAQDMLYAYRLLESLELQVELPMILEMDNKGAVDLANNWSVGGRTRHVDVRNHFLRELKDLGLLVVKFVPGDENDADIFTKNTSAAVFERHIPKFIGVDEYMENKPPS